MVIILRPEDLVSEADGQPFKPFMPLVDITLAHVRPEVHCPQFDLPSTIIIVIRHDEANFKVLKNYENRPFDGDGIYPRTSAHVHAAITFGVLPVPLPAYP